MPEKDLVSVIIPTKNSGRTLENCIRSVVSQSYTRTEIIIVDAFSTDNTREIAESYCAKIVKSSAEISGSRNIGAQKSSGKFILSLDADMELTRNVIDDCVKKAQQGYDAVIIPEESVGRGFWSRCRALEKSLYIGDDAMEAARFFRESTFNSVNGYDADLLFGEDKDLDIRTRRAGFKIARIDSLIKHHEGRLTLREALSKKERYGKTIDRYQIKHPEEARQQLSIIRPPFARNWRRLLNDPLSAVGLVILKTCELGAIEFGFLKSRSLGRNPRHRNSSGRLRVIQRLMARGRFSLSIGSKNTRFAEVNLDIDPLVKPDIVADARSLPFQNCSFEQVLFTDVIEHLPKGDESKALREIHRVLYNEGELILTTPHDSHLYTFLDPARYVMTHRHYPEKGIKDMVERYGFKIDEIFSAGALWACFSNLWYCLITYPVTKILHKSPAYTPFFVQSKESREYKYATRNGCTVFVKARKVYIGV